MNSKSTRPVALVTGSSSGIGRQIALEMGRQGYDMIVHGRTMSTELERTASDVCNTGVDCQIRPVDLRDVESLEAFAGSCWNAFGGERRIHCWINNAGADVLTDEFAHQSFFEKLEMLWQVDVVGTIHLSRLVGGWMKRAVEQGEIDSGSIINLGWDQAAHGMEGDSGQLFGTTKGAVMSFSRSLAQELAPQVRVNCVAPGWIATDWGTQAASPHWQDRGRRESLLDRWGTPEEVARVVAAIASPAFSFVNGQVLNVNGGFRLGQSANSKGNK